MKEVSIDWEAGQVVLDAHRNEFYDGPDDPLYAASAAFQRELEAEIEAAGGIEAWRAARKAEQPA